MQQRKDDLWSGSFFKYELVIETNGNRQNDFKSIVSFIRQLIA